MQLDTALSFVRDHRRGVLTTLKADGRPQLSNIFYWTGDDGVVAISATADRAKAKNLQRDGRAALHVTSDDFWSYVVVEADAEVSPVATSPDDAVVDELVAGYRLAQGEHDDWDELRASLVSERRVVLRLRPQHAYGIVAS